VPTAEDSAPTRLGDSDGPKHARAADTAHGEALKPRTHTDEGLAPNQTGSVARDDTHARAETLCGLVHSGRRRHLLLTLIIITIIIIFGIFPFTADPGLAHQEAATRIHHHLADACEAWFSYGEAKRAPAGDADANGPTAMDLRAASERAPTIDGRALPWPPEQQGIAPITFISSEHVAAPRDTQALWARRLPPEVLSTTTDLTLVPFDNHAAAAHARIHKHHPHLPICWATKQGAPPLVYCLADDTATDAPTQPLPSGKERHFTAEPGPHAK
jgi:hypothetical protein